MIVQADAWVAKCVTCGATGALGRDAVDARTIAVKDGWRAERRPGEHKSTMTCPTCIPADLRPPPAEAEATVQAWEAAASAHPECSTCGAMAAKGFDVWCPHMAATSP